MMRHVLRFVAVGVLVAAHSLSAQTARGRLLTDDEPQRPLPFATVSLHAPDGTERAVTITDTLGLWVLRAPEAGRYHLRARRLGFQMVTSPEFALEAGQTATYNFVVAIKPATLREVRVIERRELAQRLRLYGIDPRSSDARRITRAQLEALDDGFHTVSDAIRLQNIAGVTVQELGNGESCVYNQRGSAGFTGGGCMRVLLDGTPFSDLSSLSPGELELVLVLEGAAATGIYGPFAQDGIVMLFTRGNAP
jgi:hypothetical protein